jgi:ABC-type lipoprotein release transport system permease subunit
MVALLGVMAAGALAHSLVTSARRRRRDVAVLKTLGFSNAQVGAMAGWQALALAAVALLIGVPLGLIAGRWAWTLFADQISVAPAASLPLTTVLATVPLALLGSLGIAAIPAAIGRRSRPAALLRWL